MITMRPSEERGSANLGWLESRHSFSFGDYFDAEHMGFGPLRVINEDRVRPGKGFATHGHRDMEIVTFVIAGALAHKDSTGGGSTIRPGDVQRMTAGTGVRHSEFNASDTEPVHFLQIWVLPEETGLAPGYEEKRFDLDAGGSALTLIAASDGRDGSLTIHQDANIFHGRLANGGSATHEPGPGRKQCGSRSYPGHLPPTASKRPPATVSPLAMRRALRSRPRPTPNFFSSTWPGTDPRRRNPTSQITGDHHERHGPHHHPRHRRKPARRILEQSRRGRRRRQFAPRYRRAAGRDRRHPAL